jgi:hypothetical protein
MGLKRYLPGRRKGSPPMPFVDRPDALSMKSTLVVGERLPAEKVLEATSAAGGSARAWDGTQAGLAAALIELEQALEADPPGTVLLADASDVALAAALVATKLLVPVEAVPDATAGDGTNARLIGQLAATYTPSR